MNFWMFGQSACLELKDVSPLGDVTPVWGSNFLYTSHSLLVSEPVVKGS